MGLDSAPVTPSISGLRDFIHPSMWSNERFSWTKTTTVLMGEGEAIDSQVGEEMREYRRKKKKFCGVENSRHGIKGQRIQKSIIQTFQIGERIV